MTPTNKPPLLVVDDETMIRETICDYLIDSGFEVFQAENGKAALECLKEHPEIPVIITDLDMPVLNGLELLKVLQALFPNKASIIISGHGDMEALITALRLGAWNYITKPIRDLSFLEHAILQSLDKIRLIEENIAQKVILEQKNKELSHSLSELKKAQLKIIQAEKMSALGRLVAGVSHEIATPLGIGITAASFLDQKFQDLQTQLADFPGSPDFKKNLSTIAESLIMIQNNLHKTSDLLAYFKQISVEQDFFEPKTFFLKALLEQILLSFKGLLAERHIRTELKCHPEVSIYSYPAAFLEIFQHLFKNSLAHAFPDNKPGKISIEVQKTETQLEILFSDDGIGLNVDEETKIFEPFFTTSRAKGHSGLGLSIVNNLILNLLNGFVDFKNAPGKGLVFKILIPLEKV